MEIKKFTKDLSGCYEMIDKADPYRFLFTGLYQTDLKTDEEMVPYYVYIPGSAHYSERAVLIVLDDGESADVFLEKSGWRAVADRDSVVILLAEGGQEEGYYRAFFEERKNQQYFTVNKATCYLAGYGTGSRTVQKEILSRPQLWTGAFCCGDFGVHEAELKKTGEQESDVPFIKKVRCRYRYGYGPSI